MTRLPCGCEDHITNRRTKIRYCDKHRKEAYEYMRTIAHDMAHLSVRVPWIAETK